MRRGTDQPTLPGLSPSDIYAGFGPSVFRAVGEPPTGYQRRGRGAVLKGAVRDEAPRTPGVYGMLGSKGQVIYIGKAKNLRARLLSYFREGSHPKAAKIVRHAFALVWENLPDEFAALLRELELIRRFRPRFNVLGQPDGRRSVYLCLGRGPAAYAYVSREPSGKELAAYGPFLGRKASRDVVRRFNLEFGLRDCSSGVRMTFAEQGELFGDERAAKCLRYELGTCLGPCGGLCTASAYGTAVRAARDFLDGKRTTLLGELAKQMAAAAGEQKYEQAAAVRDRWQAMTQLHDWLTFLRTARANHSFVYPLVGADDRTRWYLIHGGEVRGVVPEPACAASASKAIDAIASVFAERLTPTRAMERCVDSVLIVTSWFRKRAEEKEKLLARRDALAACRMLQPVAA